MKDHAEMDQSSLHFGQVVDAFILNRDQSMNLQTWINIHTNVSNFLTSPKTIFKLFKTFLKQFCDTSKIQSFTTYLRITEGKITKFAHFDEYHRNCKKKFV